MKYIDLRERTRENLLGIIRKKDIEIIKLNNIINELEKYLIERIEYNQGSELQDYLENTYSTIYSVLQELKGSDKE